MADPYVEYLNDYRNVLQETSGISLYSQLEYLLISMIEEGKIPEGAEFFSEEEIASILGISRPTVNKAMKALIDKGYLSRERGKRSITKNPANLPLLFLGELMSFGEMLERQDIPYFTKLLNREVCRADAMQCKKLCLPEGSSLVKISRIRYVMNEPILIVDSWFSDEKFHKLLEFPEERFAGNLFQIMREEFNIRIKYSQREVLAARMSLDDAVLMQTPLWEPCMILRSINYDSDRNPVELFSSRLKGNRCILKTNLESKG